MHSQPMNLLGSINILGYIDCLPLVPEVALAPELPAGFPLEEVPNDVDEPGGNPPVCDPDVPGGNPPGCDPTDPLENPVNADGCCPVDRNFEGSMNEGMKGEDPPVFVPVDEVALAV